MKRVVLLALCIGVVFCAASITKTSDAHAGGAPDRIIRIGKQYLGTPYRKMNCSQFTAKVYWRAVRHRMPAWDDKQRFEGRWVPHKERGDLLFFGGPGHGKINHVGIYYGNGKILHASGYYHKTVISKLKFLHYYRGAKRIR